MKSASDTYMSGLERFEPVKLNPWQLGNRVSGR